jgi:hypothetical protein
MHVYTGIVSGKKRQKKAVSFYQFCIPIRDIQYGNKGQPLFSFDLMKSNFIQGSPAGFTG